VLDVLFYWWLFGALTATIGQLSARRQHAKLTLYRRFSHVLLASALLSAAMITWQLGALAGDPLDESWATLWVFDAFWHALYFAVLLAVCYLWSPTKSNLQYAYMDELGQEEMQNATELDDF